MTNYCDIRFYGEEEDIVDQFYYEEQCMQSYLLPFVQPGNTDQKQNNTIEKGFSKKAPDWRVIYPGLNLEGQCKNKSCKAYQKKGWTKKGYGEFNMNKEAHISVCLLCNQKLINVKNMGIYKARADIQGLISGEQNVFSVAHETDNGEKFITFKDKDQFVRQWVFLEVNVSKVTKDNVSTSSGSTSFQREI